MVAAIGMIVPDLFGRFGGYLSPSMDLYHGPTGWWDGGIFFSHTHGLFGGFKKMASEIVCCVFWESKVGFFEHLAHVVCVCVCLCFLSVCGTYVIITTFFDIVP